MFSPQAGRRASHRLHLTLGKPPTIPNEVSLHRGLLTLVISKRMVRTLTGYWIK